MVKILIFDLVENGFEEPEDEGPLTNPQKNQLKEQRKKDSKALSFIQQGVSEAIFLRIINATKVKETWDILQKEYRGNLKVRTIKLQSLKRDFENLKMKDMELLKDYFSRVMELVNQMKIYGDNITNKRVVEFFLISLPKKYNPIVAVIEETNDLADLSIEDLMGSIKTFEQRLSRQSKKSIESVFQSKLNVSTSNSQGRGRGRNATGRARNARGRGRSNFQRKENEESTQQKCGNCNRSNHVDKIVGFDESQNVTIATNLGMSRRIA
ncbi:uncharacterized protein LOC114314564 [Camellia sinensis]|uniref:uncharacterized protein LOC114314564 n=1 Tax=Camellia sinensis TaxID=4442 RepID=UPI00103698E7|nr:uncharacterized protein LOC114314564 [Camellia sinensis]